MSYDILAIVCLNLRCVSECMYASMCIYVYLCIYVCMYDVRHDIQIPCTRYVAINRLYLYLFNVCKCSKLFHVLIIIFTSMLVNCTALVSCVKVKLNGFVVSDSQSGQVG